MEPEKKFQQPENKEKKKFAQVVDLIPTREQEYVDPKRKWAHNDLYPSATVQVVKIGNDGRVLVKDNTGEFWVPKDKLEML